MLWPITTKTVSNSASLTSTVVAGAAADMADMDQLAKWGAEGGIPSRGQSLI